MKLTKVLLLFISFVVAVSCEKSPQANTFGFGYELLDFKLDQMQEQITNVLKALVASVKNNEKQIEDLKVNLLGNISKLSEKFHNLESTVNGNTNNLKTAIDDSNSRLLHEISDVKSNLPLIINTTRNIHELQLITAPCKSSTSSGVFNMAFLDIKVLCEMDSFNNGWLVIQQKIANYFSYKNWIEYRDGFGVVGKNESFWLGNEAIHRITNSGEFELMIQLKNSSGNYFARYSRFYVAGEDDKYRLTVGGHSGVLKDNLKFSNNMQFSTHDQDNDNNSNLNCASLGDGWWHGGLQSALNNPEPIWYPFFYTHSRMMIRRK